MNSPICFSIYPSVFLKKEFTCLHGLSKWIDISAELSFHIPVHQKITRCNHNFDLSIFFITYKLFLNFMFDENVSNNLSKYYKLNLISQWSWGRWKAFSRKFFQPVFCAAFTEINVQMYYQHYRNVRAYVVNGILVHERMCMNMNFVFFWRSL